MRTILERWKRLFVCFQLLVVKFQLTEVSRCCKYYIASAISNCCHSAPYCIRGNGPSSTTYVSGTSHHKDDNNHRATARIFTVTELHIYHKDYSWTIRIRIVQIHDDCHAYCLQLGLPSNFVPHNQHHRRRTYVAEQNWTTQRPSSMPIPPNFVPSMHVPPNFECLLYKSLPLIA